MLLHLGTRLKITPTFSLAASGDCTVDSQEKTVSMLKLYGNIPTSAEILLITLSCTRLLRRWIFHKKTTQVIDNRYVLR